MPNFSDALARLTANADVIAALARPVSDAHARWKPAPDRWSLLEVVCHLYDEEREDFRTRVRLTLEDPAADWPPIHPGVWVTERAYNVQDPATQLEAWRQERRVSLEWLRGLHNPNWESTHTRPECGSASAGQILDAWVAHDHLHIRQLNQLHWLWLAQTADPFSLDYAGGW